LDYNKFKVWASGMTEDERDLMEKHEAVETKFKEEQESVKQTMATRGFKIILDKIIDDIEVAKFKLLDCGEKELYKLQLEVKIRKEFLDKWTPYVG
jgi:hypothetical protein